MVTLATAISNIDLPLRSAKDCKVLLVDDDPRIIEVFTAILSLYGYQILTTTNGADVLRLVTDEQLDVVVLDVLMPGINGIELCQQIKGRAATRFLPVVLMTGSDDQLTKLQGLQAGADDFLNKPIEPYELAVRVRSLIRTKQLYDIREHHRQDLEQRVTEATEELRAANQRLEALNRVKSNVLAIVSHELRTPLYQAKIALDLLTKAEIDEAKKPSLLQTMVDKLKQLEYRIEDVKVFSDPTDLKLAPVPISHLITGAVDHVRMLRKPKQDEIIVTIPPEAPPVSAHALPMTRAIAHVIHNAVKFGEGKPVDVAVVIVEEGIRISVVDRGPGISADQIEQFLQPLTSGDDSETRKFGGMGIGLALANAILVAHNVKLEFDSLGHEGTTVSFTLPIAEIS